MNDQADGAVADAGQAIQRQINQAEDIAHQVAGFVRDYPAAAVLIAGGIGYLLGKVI